MYEDMTSCIQCHRRHEKYIRLQIYAIKSYVDNFSLFKIFISRPYIKILFLYGDPHYDIIVTMFAAKNIP